jgi:hypothetical protein
MLVKHLISELKKCNPEAEVITEGCDCTGDTFSLALKGNVVKISRSDRYGNYADTYANTDDTPHPLPYHRPNQEAP